MTCFEKNMKQTVVRRIALTGAMACMLAFQGCGAPHQRIESVTAGAVADQDFIEQALKQLVADLQSLKQGVMRNDEARLYVMINHVNEASSRFQTHGQTHAQTLYSLQKIVTQFLYSEYFFEFIRTVNNSKVIDRVLAATISVKGPSIRSEIGYDDPRSSILADNLSVMRTAITTVLKEPDLPDSDRATLRALIAGIGSTMALAQGQGDRPVAFREAMKLCDAVDAAYGILDKLTGTSQLFAHAQEIRGTNEFLKEYLQINIIRSQEE